MLTLQEVRANEAQSAAESRTIASTPISDRTIIGKTAQTLCKDTAIYWTYANCETNTTSKYILKLHVHAH